MLGGYRLVRGWHFLALCGFAAFVPGHLVMVAIHGWRNFTAMLTGWKRDPEYVNGSYQLPGGVGTRARD